MEPETKLTAQEYKDRFTNRRRMAWVAFLCLSGSGVFLVVYSAMDPGANERIKGMDFIIGSVFGMWTTIVLAYFGISTVTDIKGIK